MNQVGGQDELVFDGASFVLQRDCKLAVQMPAWEETIALTDCVREADGWRCTSGPRAVPEEGDAAAYAACMLGLRDYVDKTGFPGVVLGLSGGINSALVAAIAVDALGPERVHCVMLPYRYTSERKPSTDAAACAKALGVRYDTRADRAIRSTASSTCSRADVCGHRARRHRGKPAEPGARHDPDGDLQQVRRAWS